MSSPAKTDVVEAASSQQQPKPVVREHQKGHLVGHGGGLKEGLIATACGIAYGVTSPLVGHPLDTIKTKMQAQPQYMSGGMLFTAKTIYQQEGLRGFWRGILPPIFGSSIFRSVQFGAYGAAYGFLKDYDSLCEEIPYTSGLQSRVLVAGLFSSACRSVIETPLELMKVRRQTGQSWRVGNAPLNSVKGWLELMSAKQITEMYQGFGVTFLRTWGLMGTFFILVDYLVRKAPKLVNTPLIGPFIKGGVVSTIAWLVVWPLEYVKSQVQANTLLVNAANKEQISFTHRLKTIMKQQGIRGMYRGVTPGCLRSLIANGCSMIVYTYCQHLREHFEEKDREDRKI